MGLPEARAADGNGTARDAWADLLAHQYAQMVAALQPLVDAVWSANRSFAELVRQIDLVALVPVEEREAAFRGYAELLNMRRPARKVSWRRLNEVQRRRAAERWLARRKASPSHAGGNDGCQPG